MQRIGNLYPTLCSFPNLLLAYKKAKRGTNTAQSHGFCFRLENELLQLQAELLNGGYKPQPYRYFTIYLPKERQISVAAFRDRVVHHALVNVLEPIYEKSFIYHSYATRKGKGTHKAIAYAQHCLQRNQWFLKCDITKYFNNIDHSILLAYLAHKIKDRQVLQLAATIMANSGTNKGLPIGNLTSQFFANVYLDRLDHFVKQQLACKHYLRYMDDFVLFSNQKQVLKQHHQTLCNYLGHIALSINQRSSCLNSKQHGLSFLGVRIFAGTLRIKQANLRHSLKKLAHNHYLYKTGQITNTYYHNSTGSIFAHLANYNTLRLRQQWLYNKGQAE